MTDKILIVEDESRIVRTLRLYLEQAGFAVCAATDGEQALAVFKRERPSLILLDLNLPGLDGLDVCRALRRDSHVPIIMVTARSEEMDRLIGLEMGADDYVVKPFSPREVVARVRAVLRRSGAAQPEANVLRAGDLSLDRDARVVSVNGRHVDLTPMEFNLLNTLMGSPGRTFSRMELLEQAQGFAYDGYERTIDVHVKNLRKKIEADPAQPEYVLTVFGAGYRFNPNG